METQGADAANVMWFMYGGKSCAICKHEYANVTDMVNRKVVRANNPPASVELACKACFDDLHGAITNEAG